MGLLRPEDAMFGRAPRFALTYPIFYQNVNNCSLNKFFAPRYPAWPVVVQEAHLPSRWTGLVCFPKKLPYVVHEYIDNNRQYVIPFLDHTD